MQDNFKRSCVCKAAKLKHKWDPSVLLPHTQCKNIVWKTSSLTNETAAFYQYLPQHLENNQSERDMI